MATSPSQIVLAAVRDETPAPSVEPGARKATPVFIVASPRQSCGKTFVARLALDYLRIDGGDVIAYDLNSEEGSLAESRPGLTARADLGTTQAQMALFDRLIVNDGVGKVVDVGHAAFERFFALCEEIGFVGEANRRALEVVVLFPAEPHPAAVKAYDALRWRLKRGVVVPVFNDAILKGQKVREQYPFSRAAAVPIQIPVLPPNLVRYALRLDCSFTDFYTQLPMSVPMGHAFELRTWTKRTLLEFRELELRLLLEKLRASLKA